MCILLDFVWGVRLTVWDFLQVKVCLFSAGLEHKRCQIAEKPRASLWGSGLFSSDSACKLSAFMYSTEVNEKGYSISKMDYFARRESTYLKTKQNKTNPSEQGASSVPLMLSLFWNLPWSENKVCPTVWFVVFHLFLSLLFVGFSKSVAGYKSETGWT